MLILFSEFCIDINFLLNLNMKKKQFLNLLLIPPPLRPVHDQIYNQNIRLVYS